MAHNPGDFTHGTGDAGPYEFVYENELGEPIGEYHISIEENQLCGQTTTARVVSVGHSYRNPTLTRRISARYARPTVADYSFVSNSSSFVAVDRTFSGPYHSNGGVHMNGNHFAPVTSSVTDWTCGSAEGCAPTSTVDGIITTGGGGNEALFTYPVPTIDFAGLSLTLSELKSMAISGGGIYYGPLTGNRPGYRLIFLADGRVEVRRVNGTSAEPPGLAWGLRMKVINNTTLLATRTIDPTCPIIFIEDNVWIDGVVNGKVALAAANLTGSGEDRLIVLQGSITYANPSSRFLAISQTEIDIGLEVPNNMVIHGVYIAKDGQFKRNAVAVGAPPPWADHNIKNSLTVNGTIMTNGPMQTQIFDDGGSLVAGFQNHFFNYDRQITIDPPPFMPHTSDEYRFFEWRDGD